MAIANSAGLVANKAVDPSGLACSSCSTYSFRDGMMECREIPKIEGNKYMQAMMGLTTVSQAGLVRSTIESRRGSVFTDTFETGHYRIRSRGNGGNGTNGYSCFWDPQKTGARWSWQRYNCPEYVYVHVEGCLPELMDTVALPDGYSRSELVGNASLLTDLVQEQIARDFSWGIEYGFWFGVHGHGLVGNVDNKPQGEIYNGSINGIMAQLYLAWKNNYYSYTEKVTFSASEWDAGKCLYVRVGDWVSQRLSYSDYGSITALLAAVCDILNDVRYAPANVKRVFQATANGIAGELYVSVLDLESPSVSLQFWWGDCGNAPKWSCEVVNGINAVSLQGNTEIKTAPTVMPYQALGSCNTIDYLRDYLVYFLQYEMSRPSERRRDLRNMVLLIDPMILFYAGSDILSRNMQQNVSNVNMGILGDTSAILSLLNLPVSVLPLNTFQNTGMIVLAPKRSVYLMTEESSGIQGSVRSFVKDPACGTVGFEQSGYAGIGLYNPGDWVVNFCGSPLAAQYDGLDIWEDTFVRNNCVCPKEYRGSCVETYQPNCDTLYRSVMNNPTLEVSYVAGTPGDSLVLNFNGSVPMDIVSFDWAVADSAGGADAFSSGGSSHTFVFSGSLEGYEWLVSMNVVTESCPDGVLKLVRFRIVNGEMVVV